MIKSVEIENFKAIQKGKVELTPLTCFIGYNGVGKSSLLEALETYKVIVTEGLNAGMAMHRGFEHIYYKGEKEKRWFGEEEERVEYPPLAFSFQCVINSLEAYFSSSLAQEVSGKQRTFFFGGKIRRGILQTNAGGKRFVRSEKNKGPSSATIPYH